jgi:hypothetical protein
MQQSGNIEADNSIIMIKLNDPNHTYNIINIYYNSKSSKFVTNEKVNMTRCVTEYWQDVLRNIDKMCYGILTRCVTECWQDVLRNVDKMCYGILTRCVTEYWQNVLRNVDKMCYGMLTRCVTECWYCILVYSSWSWSYGSFIYNYMCNKCLSTL